jgi:phosphatidylserine decarboxylase
MNVLLREDLNFLLTNRVPRRALTRFTGWFSRIEQPLIRDLSLLAWRFFADLDLSDARDRRFRSLHACFTRELRPGARPFDPDPSILSSPCDAIVGAAGHARDGHVLQVKGFPYALSDLLGDETHAATFRDGCYATLRLTSGMYHRFHAPHDLRVTSVSHFPGDTWNVNPAALRRVERLFCRNERAVIRASLSVNGLPLTLVPVAAILVAGIRLRFLDLGPRSPRRRTFPCHATLAKGEEMGWFEHGSTIVVFAPAGCRLHETVREGQSIRAGQPLMRLPE